MSSSYTTFRVRGIPAGSSKEDAEVLVKEALASEDSSVFQLKSLANDRPRSREMVATVNFASIPAQLAKCASGAEWNAELSDDVVLVFDTHFHGCTTLFCPSEESWEFDVFAISGLNGHAFGSFKKKNESYMWLRDALRRDFPESRIIIYGYDTTLQGSKSFQNILDIGHKFRNALAEARPRKQTKPLILVGHSLGGIVVKQAINDMCTSELDQDRRNFASICGIVFFGVPNQGMNIHSLIPMVGDQPNRGLLQNLEHNSPTLRIQAKEFLAVLDNLRCDVLSFYETQKSPTARKDELGRWSMTGPLAVLVETYSATHGRPEDYKHHRVCPIDRNHSELVKFSSQYDEEYKTLVAFLNGIDYSEKESSVIMSKAQIGCLQSLGFREQYQRIDSLEPAEGTCDWLIKHEYFVDWLANPVGFLWIRGMPGSGKSMAMKRMLQHVKGLPTRKVVVASFFFHAQGVDLQKSLLGLYRALLHQLYPHSLEAFSDLTARFEEYEKDFGAGKQDDKWSWMIGEIRKHFYDGISTACKKRSIVLFVDAMDEAGELSAKEVFHYLQQLLDSLSDRSCQLRVCLSCRHYPEIIPKTGKTIIIENFNREDMATVVGVRVSSLENFNDLEKQQLKAYVLEKAGGVFQWTSLVVESIVRERKQGNSFQAALEVIKKKPGGLNFLYESLLQAGQQQYSTELDLRRALFQYVLFTVEPLSPKELQHALALSQDTKHTSIHDYESSSGFILAEDYETRINTLSKGLIQVRGSFDSGRVECIHQSVVDFLINRGGLRLLSNGCEIDPIRLAHLEISRSCLKYLFISEINDALPTLRTEVRQQGRELLATEMRQMFPFISYAWAHWIFHAVSVEGQDDKTTEHNVDNILNTFGWPNDQIMIDLLEPFSWIFGSPLESWKKAFRRDSPFVAGLDHGLKRSGFQVFYDNYTRIAEWPIEGSRLIHLFALCGLLNASTQKKMTSQPVLGKDSAVKVPAPLIYAIVGQQKQVVLDLTTAGARCDWSPWKEYSLPSPIHLASIWGDAEIISLLMNSGADPASTDNNGYRPLQLAAGLGHRAATNTLLGVRAKINSKMGNNVTALYLSSFHGHFEISKQLLKHRADPNAVCSYTWSKQKRGTLAGAISANEPEIIVLLLENGAKVKSSEMSEIVCSESLDMVKLFLEHGFNVNTKGEKNGETLLFHAVDSHRGQEMAKLLIESGANVNAVESDLHTPLHMAARRKGPEMTKLLLQHGADPDAKDRKGNTPLYDAMRSLDHETGRLLLEARANPNIKNHKGRTALMKAAKGHHSSRAVEDKIECIRLLVQFRADPTARSLSGATALSKPKNEEVDKLLRDFGCPIERGYDDNDARTKLVEVVSLCKSWGRMGRHVFR